MNNCDEKVMINLVNFWSLTEGYCIDCHNKILDGLLIDESDETKCLSDESLRIMVMRPARARGRFFK